MTPSYERPIPAGDLPDVVSSLRHRVDSQETTIRGQTDLFEESSHRIERLMERMAVVEHDQSVARNLSVDLFGSPDRKEDVGALGRLTASVGVVRADLVGVHRLAWGVLIVLISALAAGLFDLISRTVTATH